ncbi:unnamed protein product [Bursaphelenchus xylophilus]|uniref:(pine wood nematode) hypothetical protein n=1 Tax=Bursaphelenchus xylophilus TaxID=6326 RepID=A0A1I7RKZ9_BURXY|nr:unnamed protein product [Bursaphelenchus xylophilus]CAG9083656.1 unnamed protein product [Bursaphelenchus xylophilus]
MVDDSSPSKLASFRALFHTDISGPDGINVYVLPRTDAHQSEYICDRDKRVQFLSGFSGSNAYSIITESEALLWTDGRYFDQAENELLPGWTLMKQGQTGVLSPTEWLLQNLVRGSRVGFDPQLFGKGSSDELLQVIKGAKAIPVKLNTNLVDVIWENRPEGSKNPLIVLSQSEHGESIESKLERVRSQMSKKKCDIVIVSDLAQVAWLFNLRGADIPFNPCFFAYAYVTHDDVVLFVDKEKLTPEVEKHLGDVKVHPYETASEWLKYYHEEAKNSITGHKVWISPELNYSLSSMIDTDFIHEGPTPIYSMKALKNETEMAGMRESHIRDSAAIVQFLVWLKNEIAAGHEVNEILASEKMEEFRSKLDKFVSLSFDTISAVGPHAASPHYHMTEESGKTTIKADQVYLIDSGGQFRDGTTDVTRTVIHTETPDEHVKKMFTLVLKAHIICAKQTFPEGIDGIRLDGLTRTPLWSQGYDFGHGVGHGVGHFSNVHEYPPQIGFRLRIPEAGIYKGHVLTIEPGYYETDAFGIRIENCYEIVEATNLESGAKNFLAFASLTWVPIQKTLINKDLLTTEELSWLNEYHNKCLEITGKYLQEKGLQEEYNYLAEACTPL